ncbi:MAG: PIN-like domain-containing protein [Anaerolineae bacterium]
MKQIFAGYYQPTDKEFKELWQTCLFVLDANILLDLYRYSKETREKLLEVLSNLSDRLWISHQAALEYQDNRLGVITKQEKTYTDVFDLLGKTKEGLESILSQEHPSIDVQTVLSKADDAFSIIKADLEAQHAAHPDLFADDFIRDEITALLKDKVGPAYPQEKLNEISKEGTKRYENKIPPGYMDDKKKDKKTYGTVVIEGQFGDLILWHQIKDKARETKKPIIFITNDNKEDWWWIEQGKTVGPRPELITEMLTEVSVMFYMYKPKRFVEYAVDYLGLEVTQEIINEVESVAEAKINWKQEALNALTALGGAASLQEIYDEVARASKTTQRQLPVSWQAIIRRTLQNYWAESEWFLGKEDLFIHIGTGQWGLKTPEVRSARGLFRETIKAFLEQSSGMKVDKIYSQVKALHPERCNDTIECSHGNPGQPEWKHQVRFALWDLKNAGDIDHLGDEWYVPDF